MNSLGKCFYFIIRNMDMIALGIFLSYVWNFSNSFVESIICFVVLIVGHMAALILHETGHLIGALIFKLPVSGMTIGSGKNIFTIEKRNFTFALNWKMNSGAIKSTFERDENDYAFEKFRKPIFFTILSGPLVTGTLVTLSLLLFINAPAEFKMITNCLFVSQCLLLFGLRNDFEYMKSLIYNEDWALTYIKLK
ncbi:site-2 protease family protein [[Brevibacterium] frigoritolerans]|nr:site-2 protease family protein [Peribacillus frigoritolerans]